MQEAVFISLLESEGIYFSVFNDVFGSLKVGPMIPLYNQKTILVPESDLARSRDLIADPGGVSETTEEQGLSFFDTLRMFIEVIFFHWLIPGTRRRGGSPGA